MNEIWKPVVGFDGVYQVSDTGRVRSLTRAVTQAGRNGAIYSKMVYGRILRPGRMPGGHLSVALGRDNSRTVHSLIAEAFIGPCPPGFEVRHLDGVHANNHASNLQYATRSRNGQDKKHHAGARTYVLKPFQVVAIRAALDRGAVGARLAESHGVSQSTISAVKHRVFHRDI